MCTCISSPSSLVLCRRYGLLGLNGCGKSTLLKALGNREVPIPEMMDIYFLSHEIEATDMSALQAVVCVDEERERLEKEAEELANVVSEAGGDNSISIRCKCGEV